MAFQGKQEQVRVSLEHAGLHTVCVEAGCPNRSECYARGTATFLVMGSVCTRGCTFCSVEKTGIGPLDWNEIDRVAEAVRKMQLRHVVITSVTRDDLDDGGAAFFARLVQVLRETNPKGTVELLIPDLKGSDEALETVFQSRPDILNHNVETVPSLYHSIRPQADYARSLSVLRRASSFGLITKSGLMVGLGETTEEVFGVLDDLHSCGCRIVTIGQYLQPSPGQTEVRAYITPGQFEEYAKYGSRKKGFRVVAGPFVRSSYHAAEVFEAFAV